MAEESLGQRSEEHAAPRARIIRLLRVALAVLAGLVILWSFLWAMSRPLRTGTELGGRIELTVLHWGMREEDQITQTMVESFQKAHPDIRVKRINASANYWTKLQTMVAGGTPPDVMFFNSHQVPMYASRGVLLDIEPFVQQDADRGDLPFNFNDFYPQALNSFRFDGKVSGKGKLYGLPMSFTPLGFYYNKELFDKAGLAYPTDDWTWEEFEEKAKAIGKLDGCYGVDLSIHPYVFRAMLRTYGADLSTPGFESLRLDDPRVIAMLERIRSWRFSGDRMLTNPQNRLQSGVSLFTSGKVGMHGPLGRWKVVEFRKLENLDWDFAQLPRGTERSNALFVAAWCIAKNSKHPREAWALIRHLATPECQRINSGLGLALPTLKSVAHSNAFLTPGARPARSDLFLTAVERSEALQEPSESKFNAFMTRALDEVYRLGTKIPKEALQYVQREWEKEQASPLRREDYPLMPWKKVAGATLSMLGVVTLVAAVRWWRHRPRKMAFMEELTGYTLVSPWVIGFLTFTAIPMLVSLLLAFNKWSGLTTLDTARWVGLGNIKEMISHDERLWRSLWVTVYFVILAVPVGQVASLTTAMLMSNQVRGIGFFRSAWYLPSVLAGVGMAVLWTWVFDTQNGLLNTVLSPVLGMFGLRPPDWFGTDAAIFGVSAFVIMGLWGIGSGMLIYLAGLTAIPQTLYEAALIDGAGWWARFWNVTIPMLSPVILFNVVMAIIGSFQVFTQAYIVTGGGPGDATLFYVLYLFNQAFEYYEMGYASAMAWLLFTIVLSLTLLVIRSSSRHVYYEGMRL